MSVYVDDVRFEYGRMIMCHMWADTTNELLEMADKIGMQRKWLQCPPKARWTHFDISLSMKKKAIENGAILTDRYGALEFFAKITNNERSLENIRLARESRAKRELI
jgi:hypothetical protein